MAIRSASSRHYYGREAGLELREDIDTVLEPDMVVSIEPMIMLPEGEPGAGGYREHDILVVTEDGAENITGFPYGPEHNIVGAHRGEGHVGTDGPGASTASSRRRCGSSATTASSPSRTEYRDAKPLDQTWIWAGANIAPINWVLGALGIVLGLGFWDTVLALALGNLVGMGLFGLFVLMGQRTGTTQMVMSRSAFGRRGAYLPAFFQLVIPTGWIAINTWIILELSATLFEKIGIPGTDVTKVILVLVIMAIQVGLATLGFYAIRTFEKWTVPLTLIVLVAMSIVAWTEGRHRLELRGRRRTAPRAGRRSAS